MVLSHAAAGAAGSSGGPCVTRPRTDPGDRLGERGSQALEAALVLPLVVLLLVLLLHGGLLAVDFVAAQGLAREAARIAAVADDDTVRAALTAAAGRQTVALELDPAGDRDPGTFVTAHLELRSRAFLAFGLEAWLPAEATMAVEDR